MHIQVLALTPDGGSQVVERVPEAPAVVETEPERRQRELEAADAFTMERLEADRKAMAKRFYTYIQTGRWQKASGLVHPNEWELFLDKEGNLTDLSKRRLQAMAAADGGSVVSDHLPAGFPNGKC